MIVYKQKEKTDDVIARFTLEQLEEAIEALKESGAQEIGIPLQIREED